MNNSSKFAEIQEFEHLKIKSEAASLLSDHNFSQRWIQSKIFNLSPDEYKKELESKGGVCAICKNECTRALAVDHNHITGQVRGLLCNKCNRGIGYLSDSIDLLQASIDYLKEYKIDGG